MADEPINRNSGVITGLDSPHSIGAGGIDDRGRLRPDALKVLFDDIAPRYAPSRQRMLFTSEVTMGKTRGKVPRKFSKNVNIFAPLIPMQITDSLHNANVISRKDARLKRYTSGISPTAMSRATRVEQWSNPFVKKLVSWDELSGMIQHDGEMAGWVLPSGVVPQQKPPPFKDPGDDTPRPEWWRDASGRGIEDYFGKEDDLRRDRDGKLTSEAYEEALRDWEIENPAIAVSLIHATDCVPVGHTISGDGPKVEGIITRERFSRNALIKRQFIWGTGPGLDRETREGPRDVDLYTGYLSDEYGLPYLVYSVNGLTTRWNGGTDDDWAFIDLFKEYGMTRPLCFYEEGLHFTARDPAMRTVPFAYPFASGWLAMQTMLGAAISNFWSRGHGSRGILPREGAPRDAYMDGSEPRRISWEPGGDMPVLPGEVVDMLPQVISPDSFTIFEILGGGIEKEGPPPGAYGGAGPESGRERTVIRRHVEDSQAHILAGSLRMYQKLAIGILELATLMTKRGLCKPIPVPTTVPISKDGKGTRRRGQIVTLDPNDVQGNYSLEAYFRPQPGDNLALAELAKGLVQAGLRPRRWFHEDIMGDEQPEQTEAEIVSDSLVNSDDGMAEIRALAAQIRNSEREGQIKALRDQGRVSPSGTPLSMAGGLNGPPAMGPALEPAPGGPEMPLAGGPGPVGVGPGYSPSGMLGGQVAADMETQSLRGEQRAVAAVS